MPRVPKRWRMRTRAGYCRLALETAVGWLYRYDRTLKDPYDPTLAALLAELSFQALVRAHPRGQGAFYQGYRQRRRARQADLGRTVRHRPARVLPHRLLARAQLHPRGEATG
jgi:hypothetical protein